MVSASNKPDIFFPEALFHVLVLSNCFRGPEKNCLRILVKAALLEKRNSLRNFIAKLLIAKEISQIAEVERLDVATVREQSGVEAGGDDGLPQDRPSLSDQEPLGKRGSQRIISTTSDWCLMV